MKTYRTNFRAASREASIAMIREERDLILADTVDRMNPMRWAALSDEKKAEWELFRTRLLNITNAVPASFEVTWPAQPE